MPDPAIFEWPGGLTWLADPDEPLQRASHAIVEGDDVWVVDPVASEAVYEALDARGAVAGVVLLLDRHRRDAGPVADRYGVSIHVPEVLDTAADRLGAPVERFAGQLGDTGYRSVPVVGNRLWREAALVGDGGDSLVVPEAVGTNAFNRVGDERLGVHVGLRLTPPRRQLGGLDPERVLVGHGEPVLEDGAAALADALAGSRRRAPRAYLGALRAIVGSSGRGTD